jgi:formimidoylglutamate deiminase
MGPRRMNSAGQLFAQDALLPTGWASRVLLQWNAEGFLTHVQADTLAPPGVEQASGPLLPGLPNLHSHAFQRAMAGLTELRSDTAASGHDSFWTWRALMYRFAARLSPELLEAIALGLYVEMLEAGYTSVCEFHYVHHQSDGRPYASDAAMSLALLSAARQAGIALTLLPVLYQSSGFGALPPNEGQRRFVRSSDSLQRLLETLKPACDAQGARLGLAPHSLRAVPPEALRLAVAGLQALDPGAPIHIHIAEQAQEVRDCLAWSGQRPVAWLLDHAEVDARWCLVHATHMDAEEYRRAAASCAVAGLCPSTEANLGDGIFDWPAWQAAGGRWGLGSDSHICVNAAEELMLLEYSQRLASRQRNVGATATQRDTATALMLAAVQGGAQATGLPVAGLAVGQQANALMLSPLHPALQGLPAPAMLAAHVFASHRSSAIEAVWVSGQQRVRGGQHTLGRTPQNGLIQARQLLLSP